MQTDGNQVDALFGHLLPATASLAPQLKKNSSRPAPKWQRVDARRTQGQARKRERQDSEPDHNQLLKLLIQTVLRQGDQLNRMSVELGFFLVLRTQPAQGSVICSMFRVASEWKRLRRDDPTKLTEGLGTTMFKCLLLELSSRIKVLSQNKDAQNEAIKVGILNQEGHFVYKRWDPQQSKQVLDESRNPLPSTSLCQTLEVINNKVGLGRGLARFQATKPITEDTVDDAVPFFLETSIRDDDFHQHMQLLTDLSALELIAGRMRAQRDQRSNQADQLQKMLRDL